MNCFVTEGCDRWGCGARRGSKNHISAWRMANESRFSNFRLEKTRKMLSSSRKTVLIVIQFFFQFSSFFLLFPTTNSVNCNPVFLHFPQSTLKKHANFRLGAFWYVELWYQALQGSKWRFWVAILDFLYFSEDTVHKCSFNLSRIMFQEFIFAIVFEI